MKGVEVVGAAHGGVQRLYTSHWVSQVSFEEPIVMASVSPKHDTFPLIEASGEFVPVAGSGQQKFVEGRTRWVREPPWLSHGGDHFLQRLGPGQHLE